MPGPIAPAPGQPAGTPILPVSAGPVTTTSRPAKRTGSSGWVNILLAVSVAVAIGGVAFAVGRSTAPSAAAGQPGRLGNGAGTGQFPTRSGVPGFGGPDDQGGLGGRGGGPTISGTVDSINGDTMTVKTASGRTVEVTLGSSTTYSTSSPATQSDIKTGANVQVRVAFDGSGGFGNGGGASGPLGTASNVTVVP